MKNNHLIFPEGKNIEDIVNFTPFLVFSDNEMSMELFTHTCPHNIQDLFTPETLLTIVRLSPSTNRRPIILEYPQNSITITHADEPAIFYACRPSVVRGTKSSRSRIESKKRSLDEAILEVDTPDAKKTCAGDDIVDNQ